MIEDVLTRARGAAPLAIFLRRLPGHHRRRGARGARLPAAVFPGQRGFAIASQDGTAVSLARLQARDAVIELGFDDLRFDGGETRRLPGARGAALSESEVARLAEETE